MRRLSPAFHYNHAIRHALQCCGSTLPMLQVALAHVMHICVDDTASLMHQNFKEAAMLQEA